MLNIISDKFKIVTNVLLIPMQCLKFYNIYVRAQTLDYLIRLL